MSDHSERRPDEGEVCLAEPGAAEALEALGVRLPAAERADIEALGAQSRGKRRIVFIERAVGEERRQALDAGDVPCGAVTMAGERREGIRLGETGQVAAVELRAMREIGHARERRHPSRGDDPLRAGFREPGDDAKTETQRGRK